MTSTAQRRADNVEAIAAVTPMQQGILFHALQAKGSDPYFIQRVFEIGGPLNPDALQRAWQRVSDRHQVLRADYRWEEAAKPAQLIYKARAVELPRADWRGLAPDTQLARLRDWLARERAEGYDFRRASELRLQLFELADDATWLVFSYHHIALDGWSTALILGDVLRTYHALTTGAAYVPGAVLPYTAYVEWIHGQDAAQASVYWQKLLEGAELPTPLPRVDTRGDHGHTERALKVSSAESELLRSRARELNITVNTLVQGAWALLLGRYTNSGEVVFGTTVSGRSAALPGIDQTAGLFINTLPSRVRLTASMSVRDWLSGIQARDLDSRRHEHTPLGEIRRAAGVAGDQNLFDSLVVFENFPLDEVLERQPSGLRVQPLATDQLFEAGVRTTGRNNYPLTLNVIPAEQLVLTVAYQRDWFDAAAIDALVEQLRRLMLALSQRPQARLGEIGLSHEPAVDGGEARPAREYVPLLEAFAQNARLTPEACALQVGERTCSYAELDAASNRLARALIERGVGPEQRVGLCAERSIEFVIGVLGSWKAGAAYVALDPKLPAARRAELERDSDVQLSLRPDELGTSAHSSAPLATRPHSEQAAYVTFTSGSTGRPKGVVVNHGALARYTHGVLERLGMPQGASMALVSSVAADLGHTVLFGSLCSGGRLHLLDETCAFDPDAFAEYMARYAIDVLKIVPSHFAALLHAADPARVVPKRLLILGGEATSWELAARIRTLRPECRLINHYGPTETTVGVAAYELQPVVHAASQTLPIGRALPSAELELLDRDLNRVPDGVAAELYIGGARLARGYLGQPALTAERFVPNPYGAPGERMYRTGDRVRRHADGELEFLGRFDRQIKLRGHRIELGEIEGKLRSHPAVRAAAVTLRGTQLVGCVVAEASSEAALLEYLRGILPDHMLPARILLLERLPLTRNGKLDLGALPEHSAPAQKAAESAANSDIEQTLMTIWSEVLRVPSVGPSEDFFKLGGDSILSLQVVARARRRGLKVTPQQLFEHRTVRELAQVTTPVQPKTAVRPAPQPLELPSGDVPLLPIQARFFARELPEPHRYNQSVMLRARCRLQDAQLSAALSALLTQHDALRLRFRRGPGGSWQQSYAEPSADVPLWTRRVQAHAELEPLADAAHASLDLEAGPVLRAVLIEGPGEEQRLLAVIHHLVVDGVSWRVLLEDLQLLYRSTALPGKTTSLQRWSRELSAYAQSEAPAQQLPYWLAQLQGPSGVLPGHNPHGKNLVVYAEDCRLRLDREQTAQLLRRAPEHYGSQVQELLLAALARAFSSVSGSPSLSIELESHGREELFDGIDLSRSVGWYTSLFPLRLTPEGDAVRAVSAQLRSVPQRGLGFGVLRYLAPEAVQAQLRELPRPQVTFNYLGQFDSSFGADALFEPARESSGRAQSEHAQLGNLLTISGQVYGDELELTFVYSRDVYERESVEALVRAYRSELEALIARSRS